jgi:hypothetical protein
MTLWQAIYGNQSIPGVILEIHVVLIVSDEASRRTLEGLTVSFEMIATYSTGYTSLALSEKMRLDLCLNLFPCCKVQCL